MQVELQADGQFKIPDHEVVTRRMQFRAKKGRKAKKMEKKAEKKEQAAKKKEQREQKKAEKQKKAEEKKIEKASKKAEKKKRGTEEETTEGIAPKSQKTELSSPPEIESGSQTCSGHSKKFKTRRHRKRGLLRQMKVKKTYSQGATEMAKKKDNKKTEAPKEIQKNETMGTDQKRLSSQPPKSQRKPKAAKVSEDILIDPDAKGLVMEILQECRDSECTHPSWELPAYDKNLMALSIYWSRFAVGIKMPPKYASPKSKKDSKKSTKWNQIAYFSCNTCCPYSNIALARLYVP